jgi:hypothetical protein
MHDEDSEVGRVTAYSLPEAEAEIKPGARQSTDNLRISITMKKDNKPKL